MLTDEQGRLLVACCQQLVRTESGSGDEEAAARVAEEWMHRLGYDRVWVDAHGSVIGQIVGAGGTHAGGTRAGGTRAGGTRAGDTRAGDTGAAGGTGAGDGPGLLLDGHLDTVPVTSRDAWRHEPFGGELSEGAIWGRGSADMKGPLAAMLCGAAFAARDRFRGVVTVSASVHEETLEGQALRAIIERTPVQLVVIGESTGLELGTAQKGRAGIRMVAHGRAAHSSVPHEGVNAVYRMLEAVRRVRELDLPHDELLGPAVMELVEIVSSPYPGSGIVPDGCSTRWDRRLVRGETREGVLEPLRRAVADLPGIVIDYLDVALRCYTGTTLRTESDFHPAWETPRDSPLVQAARAALQATRGEARQRSIPYCTNGSVCAGELGLHTIVLGPGDPAQFHVVDEHIEVEQLLLGAATYARLIEHLYGCAP
jgi:putative selenium metabolism hydrolase